MRKYRFGAALVAAFGAASVGGWASAQGLQLGSGGVGAESGGRDGFTGFSEAELALDEEWPQQDIATDRTDNAAHRNEVLAAKFRGLAGDYARERIVLATNALEDIERSRAALGAARNWWDDEMAAAMAPDRRVVSGGLGDFVYSALANSEQVKVFGDLPAIRETGIAEAEGRFVPELFAEARIEQTDEFSSSLAETAGDPHRLRNEREVEVGIRSRLRTGGEITLAQRFTDIESNETAFQPNEDQVRSRTVLTLLQPLLRGSGSTVANAPTEIARLDTDIARFEFWRQTESHLLEVERAYWALYLARAEFMQMNRLARRTAGVAGRLAARSELDADAVLISRARAASTARQAELVRARTAIRNAEARLAALLNDPLLDGAANELVPMTAPGAQLRAEPVTDLIDDVLTRRPEVQQAFLQHQASIIREGVAANEALPQLDLVLEGRYSGGANGNSLDRAFDDSLNEGFGYLIGLRFSIPLGYDERAARRDRRVIETRQQERQVNVVMATAFLDLETALNEYRVAIEDVSFAERARKSAQNELFVIDRRWREGGLGEGGLALLSALLDAQERLQQAERNTASAQASLEIASANMARARGGLLDRWGVSLATVEGRRGQPTYRPITDTQ
ncbi:MAG: TolC family protein [Pseudomonadota bacterium]